MRRFASVFIKRDDRPPLPALVPDNANSSASSSGSASVYLHTPDEEHHNVVPTAFNNKPWKSWLRFPSVRKSRKNLTSIHPIPRWSQPDDILSEPSLECDPSQLPPTSPRTTMKIIVQNSIVSPPYSPSPFSHYSDPTFIFPRSINPINTLPASQSLSTSLLKTRLLAALQDDSTPVNRHELSSLAPRRVNPVIDSNPPHDPFNESLPPGTTVISLSSPGLRRWISRPCFEDRYNVFLPEQDSEISGHSVTGTNVAVAALEYSEALDAMVDPDFAQISSLEVPSSTMKPPSPPSSLGQNSRNSPYITVPSPLRNEHNQPQPPAKESTPPPVNDMSVKRGVRFVEDDKEDVIPLGYVLRRKKKREEKARFLEAERERREMEEKGRLRLEDERRRHEAERVEWENDRKAWEREKQAMEEERRQRKYTEAVIAARIRRETQRAGIIPGLRATGNGDVYGLLGRETSSTSFPPPTSSERNKSTVAHTHRYSRPIYDDGGAPITHPRREASEPNLPKKTSSFSLLQPSPRGSVNSHSTGSSRPPSMKDMLQSAESSPLPGTPSPSSVYSSQELSSSEDVKTAMLAAANRSKRSSLATSVSRNNSSSSLGGDRIPFWTSSNVSLNNMIPPVPMVPMPVQMQMMPVSTYMMDMPLLPPSPPFMMQQYPRLYNSSKGQVSNSRSSSREKVNEIGNGRSDGSRSRNNTSRSATPLRPQSLPRAPPKTSATPSASHTPFQHNHRTASSPEFQRRASMPTPSHDQQKRPRRDFNHEQSPPSQDPHLHSVAKISNRSSLQYLPPPSPWTGLPTQSGNLPDAAATFTRHTSFQQGVGTPTQVKRRTMIS